MITDMLTILQQVGGHNRSNSVTEVIVVVASVVVVVVGGWCCVICTNYVILDTGEHVKSCVRMRRLWWM